MIEERLADPSTSVGGPELTLLTERYCSLPQSRFASFTLLLPLITLSLFTIFFALSSTSTWWSPLLCFQLSLSLFHPKALVAASSHDLDTKSRYIAFDKVVIGVPRAPFEDCL
ncbi:hypothetical protein LIA77_04334 [Sarocladium implicatum]|jgi:hypothetical protein|nr:hypothetical protein LIA77_04334 [Sarocladium implicatum]